MKVVQNLKTNLGCFSGVLNHDEQPNGKGRLVIDGQHERVIYDGEFRNGNFLEGELSVIKKEYWWKYFNRTRRFNNHVNDNAKPDVLFHYSHYPVEPLGLITMNDFYSIKIHSDNFCKSDSEEYPFLPEDDTCIMKLLWVDSANKTNQKRNEDRLVVFREGKKTDLMLDMPLVVEDVVLLNFGYKGEVINVVQYIGYNKVHTGTFKNYDLKDYNFPLRENGYHRVYDILQTGKGIDQFLKKYNVSLLRRI